MATPKLRFKEFDGDWSAYKLKELTDVLKCGVASTPTYVEVGGYPFLSAQNVTRDGLMNYSKVNNISDEFYKKISKTKLLKGDILYSRVGASYGVASIFDKDEEYGVYVSLTHIRPNIKLNNIFLKLFLNSPKARKQAEQGVFQGGGVQNLNVGVVEEFDLSIPFKEEQTKIASFLSAVDEKISQLTQKHELLNQYKLGMMQKLFSQQIRFKADDGSEFGEWEETTLGEKGSFLKGKGISKADILEDGILPCIRYGELYTYYSEIISNVISATNLDRNSLILSKANDVLIPASGETQIDIATASCVLDDDIALSGDLNIYRTKENGIFLSYMIRSSLKMQIAQLAQGNSVVHLYSSQLKGVQLSLPCLEEQTKIAHFLSRIDQKIEVVAQQIEQAKQWKKGLLQQMFV